MGVHAKKHKARLEEAVKETAAAVKEREAKLEELKGKGRAVKKADINAAKVSKIVKDTQLKGLKEDLRKMEVAQEKKECPHPGQVYAELPPALKACFMQRNIPGLQKLLSEMPKKDAKYHMDRLTKSGLW